MRVINIKNLLKVKIKQYFLNEISKGDICKWSIEILHKMLRESIFELRHLEVWEIITGLSGINDMDDVYCDELLLRFDKMLSGEKSSVFTAFVQIPGKFVVNNLAQTKRILLKYAADKRLSKADILELELISNKVLHAPSSLNEMLEMQILDLLKLGYDFCAEEESVRYSLKHTLFVNENMPPEFEYLKNILALMDCYDGQKGFVVRIIFSNGAGNISVQI